MSLLKQLLLSVTVAILVILVGTLAFSIEAARQYLDGQLQSESENAASSLALSLSQPANQDPITRELLMMAMFDGGQFRMIRLTSPTGETLFERVRQAGGAIGSDTNDRQQAPQWFVDLLPLAQPQAQRVISDGWKQVGELTLAVGDSYARTALWQSSSRMALLVLVAGSIWAIFVIALLQWFRRVLQQEISSQVRAIASSLQNTDSVPEPLPAPSRVAELSSVVTAIADTKELVRVAAKGQSDRIESLELEVNQDPVTLLPNRKYFVNELRRALAGHESSQTVHGFVMLFRQRDLPAVNAQMSRISADAWLTTVGERLNQLLAEHAEVKAQLARLNGSDFVVLMPGLDGPQAMHLVQQIRQLLQSLRVMLASGQWCRWSFALTDYTPSSSVSGVLARLDYALMRAESSGHSEVEFAAYGDEEAGSNLAGENQWRQMLVAALAAPDHLSLAVHPMVFKGMAASAEHSEALLSLCPPGGKPLMGSLFLPVAVRAGMSADFDLRAVVLGFEWLQDHAEQRLVVRVSLPSLMDTEFLPQLLGIVHLPVHQSVSSRLVLEIDAHHLIAYPEEVTDFCVAMPMNWRKPWKL